MQVVEHVLLSSLAHPRCYSYKSDRGLAKAPCALLKSEDSFQTLSAMLDILGKANIVSE